MADLPLMVYPLLAMVFLTLAVAIVMYKQRISFMKKNRIHPEKVSDRKGSAHYLTDTRSSDNYMNLFEMPMLFYVAALLMLILNISSELIVALSWAYVAFRVAHSVIHCSYNRVMHRFAAFVLSAITLLSLWIALAVQIIFDTTL